MRRFLKMWTLIIGCILLNLTCTKILTKISEDDPCICAYLERKKLKNVTDDFERKMIQSKADAYDQICHDRNKIITQQK